LSLSPQFLFESSCAQILQIDEALRRWEQFFESAGLAHEGDHLAKPSKLISACLGKTLRSGWKHSLSVCLAIAAAESVVSTVIFTIV
jgi:hypothetical protein